MRYCLKDKRRFGETLKFLLPKLVIFNVWCMSIVSWLLMSLYGDFDPRKTELWKLWEKWWSFVITREYSKCHPICHFYYILSCTDIIKVVRKIRNTDETISIYPLVSVNKYCIKISVSKYVRNCNSMQRMIYDKTNCCLKNAQLFCPKGKTEFLWGILMWSHHQ